MKRVKLSMTVLVPDDYDEKSIDNAVFYTTLSRDVGRTFSAMDDHREYELGFSAEIGISDVKYSKFKRVLDGLIKKKKSQIEMVISEINNIEQNRR
jgi:hypothetical protein